MMAMADQEELNHLFSVSSTDEDLLRAVEQIENNQISEDETAQRSDIKDVTVGSISNLETSAGPYTQDGKFIISFEYLQKPHMPPRACHWNAPRTKFICNSHFKVDYFWMSVEPQPSTSYVITELQPSTSYEESGPQPSTSNDQ